MARWIEALCAIRFDLEQGQVVDECYPAAALSEEEESMVAFSSFPDSSRPSSSSSSSSSIHDSIFFFRIRRTGNGSSGFLYGYVFNRQRHDERLRRGGDQRSVVVLSYLPYWSVFKSLAQIAGPLYYDIGSGAFEKLTACVTGWPPPKHGSLMELPIMSMTIRAHLPEEEETETVDLFGVLRGLVMELWLLWELVLVGESILVLAPTPTVSSDTVAALVSLISPLSCSMDFRPYFTVHDPEFCNLTSDNSPMPHPMLLGVTNLHFIKAVVGNKKRGLMPHVLAVQQECVTQSRQRRAAKKDGPLSLLTQQHREALWTSGYLASTKPDTALLNRLVDAAPSPRIDHSVAVVNNDILHRHFFELTSNFLAPFGPYLRACGPGQGISPFVDTPALPPFDAHTFLAQLEARGPGKFLTKRLRTNWIDLYRRFIGGCNFMPWFQRRRDVAGREQQRLWRHARSKADIRLFISNMSEVEIIDLFHGLVRNILQASSKGTDLLTCNKLRSDLKLVFKLLPVDMQQLLLCNPQHLALLQSSKEPSKLPGRPSIYILRSQQQGNPGGLIHELASDPLDLNM